jgi:hypothetical protein
MIAFTLFMGDTESHDLSRDFTSRFDKESGEKTPKEKGEKGKKGKKGRKAQNETICNSTLQKRRAVAVVRAFAWLNSPVLVQFAETSSNASNH